MQPTLHSRIRRLQRKFNKRRRDFYINRWWVEDFWPDVKSSWRESDAARVAEIEQARQEGHEAGIKEAIQKHLDEFSNAGEITLENGRFVITGQQGKEAENGDHRCP